MSFFNYTANGDIVFFTRRHKDTKTIISVPEVPLCEKKNDHLSPLTV